jgi:hypothetical protein
MGSVPGFRAYSVISTDTGGITIVAGDDKESTDEIGRRMREWVQAEFPGFTRTPPQIIEGEGVFRIEHRVSDVPPHVVVRLFGNPVPTLLRENEAEIREMMTGVPGFRAYSVIDTGAGGVSITVCDDKASIDEVARHMVAWVQAKLPDVAPPQIIEGEGVFRFVAQATPA